MFNTIVGAGAVGAGAASRYGSGSGSDQKMRLLAVPAPAPQHCLKYLKTVARGQGFFHNPVTKNMEMSELILT
jgi:hypothetical protein